MQPEDRPSPAFTPTRIRLLGWGVAILLLALPALDMLRGGETNWGAGNFLTAAFLLAATGLAIELIVRMTAKRCLRFLGAGAAVLVLVIIWVELAVGVVGQMPKLM